MTEKTMETRIIRAMRDSMDMNGLRIAAEAVAAGQLVAFPTETVYGLGANALDENAVRKIFDVKGRPTDNPLIIHLAHTGLISTVVTGIPDLAVPLIERFMPGPLTLVFGRAPHIPSVVSAGLGTVAVRCPSHPVAQAFLSMAGVPVAAPSANLSGRPSPTRAVHVLQDLDGRIPFIIDGGQCEVGLESTVLDVTGTDPVLLRPGAVTAGQIEEACGRRVVFPASGTTGPVRSPGMKYRHYAPRADVLVGTGRTPALRIRNTLDAIRAQIGDGRRVGVFASSEVAREIHAFRETEPDAGWPEHVLSFGDAGDSVQASARLFDALRTLDDAGADVIVIQSLPEEGLGAAYMNRVLKASAPKRN
ncbi:MAG: threonylcarbamoyl-AMP synthase [Clostridia bacterium]|nr:threonylcarbamoyl-AMP synthase [Clostridia bacterium]